jgi:hypothetical protein
LFFNIGVPDYNQVQIGDVLTGSPAACRIKIDDIVVTANGSRSVMPRSCTTSSVPVSTSQLS